jgi:hypothetical protein
VKYGRFQFVPISPVPHSPRVKAAWPKPRTTPATVFVFNFCLVLLMPYGFQPLLSPHHSHLVPSSSLLYSTPLAYRSLPRQMLPSIQVDSNESLPSSNTRPQHRCRRHRIIKIFSKFAATRAFLCMISSHVQPCELGQTLVAASSSHYSLYQTVSHFSD